MFSNTSVRDRLQISGMNFKNLTFFFFLVSYFTFLLLQIPKLGPTWDDWYYPKTYNDSLNFSIPDFSSFSTGYGLGGFVFVDFFSRFITFDFGWLASDDFENLSARRIILLGLSFWGAVTFRFIVRRFGFSSQIANMSTILLLLTPNWIGQSLINIKDIPVAVGLLLICSSLLAIIQTGNKFLNSRNQIYIFIKIVIGVQLSFGTRFGLAVYIFVATALVMIYNKYLPRKDRKTLNRNLFLSFFTGYLLLIPFNLVLINPLLFFPRAVFGTLNLFNQPAGPVLTNGSLLDGNNPPLWYLPLWTVAQMPVTYFLIITFTILYYAILLIRNFKIRDIVISRFQPTFKLFFGNQKFLMFSVFVFLTVAPYFSALILRPPLYDGDRHFLMAYPFFVYIMMLGIKKLFNYYSRKIPIIAFLLLTSIVISPTVSLLKIAPFFYSYRSELISNPNNWEGDYMGVSLRQAVINSNYTEANLSYDFSDERWLVKWNQLNIARDSKRKLENGYLYIATRRGARTGQYLTDCREIKNVAIDSFQKNNILAFVYVCPKEFIGNR